MSEPTSAFRIAFVGLDHPHGAGWRKVLANLGDAVEITAIVPRYDGGLASLEERHATAARFETVDQLIAKGSFDGAIVCLPNNESPQALAQLAAAGKHILAEKPAAGNAEAFREVVTAVRDADVAFQNGYMWRYDQGAERIKRMVDDESFGKLVSIEISSVTANVARRGPGHYLFNEEISEVGYMNWLACHWLDLLLHLIDEPVVAVTARTGCFGANPVGVDDGGVAIMELSGGGIASFHGGYFLPRWTGENRLSFRGRDRWVNWDPSHPGTSGVLDIHGPQPQFDAMNEQYTLPPDDTPGYGGYRAVRLIEDWIASAGDRSRAIRNTAESTLATLQLIDAIYRSSEEGRRVECEIQSL